MEKRPIIVTGLLATLIVSSLLPLGNLLVDRIRYAELIQQPSSPARSRGFDWVHWDDADGQVTAVYVFPNGSGHDAGIRQGDILYEFDFVQYFNSESVKYVIGGVHLGDNRTYTLLRGTEMLLVTVAFSQYPTFLYPLGAALWQASIWGFIIGAFIHLLALIIVTPLSFKSRPSFRSFLLIAASASWVFGNLIRILMVTWFGPADALGTYPTLFAILTILSLCGWIAFPVLLLHKVLCESRLLRANETWLRYLVMLPPAVLGVCALLASTYPGWMSPVTVESLIAPILFYVCCFVTGAAAINLAQSFMPDNELAAADESSGPWSRAGSAIVMFVAALAALSVFGAVPIFGVITDEDAGWLVVGVQLLSVAPVLLVSFVTMQYGKIDQVLRRALTYLVILGLFFFLFVGGLSLVINPINEFDAPAVVIAGLWAVVLLFVFDRTWRVIGPYATEFFRTDKQKAHQRLRRFSERMRSFVDVEQLIEESAETVWEALGADYACIHMITRTGPITVAYPPTGIDEKRSAMAELWSYFEHERQVWARNPELSMASMPPTAFARLSAANAAIVVPMRDDDNLIGLFVLGRKQERRAVYSLEDVDLIRSLSSQLALAVERLEQVARERELIRTTAESQLTALRAQINPHFLFNTLNAIASLIEEKPGEAEKTVEHLSAIFRHTLDAGGQAFVPLHEEMALVDHYLSIEQVRFGDRLSVERTVETGLEQTLVPAFSVQTLVENAVKHGLARVRGGGVIRITARRGSSDHDHVEIEVSDSGVGIPALFGAGQLPVSDGNFFGIGLKNVSSRLQKLYGLDDLLLFESGRDTGTRVTIRVPAATPNTASDAESTHS